MPKRILKASVVDVGEIDSLELLFSGDYHFGDEHHDPKLMDMLVDWLNGGENRRFVNVGDTANFALKQSVSDVYGNGLTPKQTLKMYDEFLHEVHGKMIGAVSGNHDNRVYREVGLDPIGDLHRKYGIPYSEGELFLSIKVGCWEQNRRGGKKRSPVTYKGYLIHGSGGGQDGAQTNKVVGLRNIVSNADFYAQGHVHQPKIIPKVIYQFDTRGENIIEHESFHIIAPAMMKRGGYAINKTYPPVSTRFPILTLDGRQKHIDARLM